MATEIVIALIASFTSLFVGVTTLIIAILNNRHSSRSLMELEKLKLEFSRSAAQESKSDVHLTEYLKALQEAVQTIQKVKDETQIALQGLETGNDVESCLRDIVTARQTIFSCYENHLAVLSKREAKLLHDAKNISLLIEGYLKTLIHKDGTVTLSNENKQKLSELRAQLTDVQQGFRDIRAEFILKKLGLPLSWLDEVKETTTSEKHARDEAEQSRLSANTISDHSLSSPAVHPDESNPPKFVSENGGPHSLEGLQILFVDDSIDVRLLMTKLLEALGATVASCITAREAVEMVRQWRPDVVVSDIGLPYEDGYVLIKTIRELKTYHADTPVIALTAYSSQDDRESLLAAGFNRYLTKPVDISVLINEIAQLTGRRHA